MKLLQFVLTLTIFVFSFEYEKQPVTKQQRQKQQTTRVATNKYGGMALDCTGGT